MPVNGLVVFTAMCVLTRLIMGNPLNLNIYIYIYIYIYMISSWTKYCYCPVHTYTLGFSLLSPARRVEGLLDPGLSVRLSVCQQFLFRARSPILLGGMEWNLAQWKNIYCSCAPGYRFYRAAKNVPVGLDWKSRFLSIMGLSYSALDLRHY